MNDSLLMAVERTDNLVRRGSHPRLSVILIVEGSPSYAMRALESVQNQDLYDLQIVAAWWLVCTIRSKLLPAETFILI